MPVYNPTSVHQHLELVIYKLTTIFTITRESRGRTWKTTCSHLVSSEQRLDDFRNFTQQE